MGMMEKFNDVGGVDPKSKSALNRSWKDDTIPLWWKRYSAWLEPQATRSFGKVEFGEDGAKFEMVVDLGEAYKPDDVKVSIKLVNERELHVEATMEAGSTKSGNYHKQNFSNVVLLPQEADIDSLKSTLSENGLLKVEAPMMTSEKQDEVPLREIEIERESTPKVKPDA